MRRLRRLSAFLFRWLSAQPIQMKSEEKTQKRSDMMKQQMDMTQLYQADSTTVSWLMALPQKGIEAKTAPLAQTHSVKAFTTLREVFASLATHTAKS